MKIIIVLGLAFLIFQTGCMGSPKSFTPTSNGGGFTGAPPPATTPNPTHQLGSTGTFIESAGGISTSAHTQMRMAMGDSLKDQQVATSPHTSVYINIQSDIHTNSY
jgi:hypothetical protein